MAATACAALTCDACGARETIPIRVRLGRLEHGTVTCYTDLDDDSRGRLDVFLQAHVAPRALRLGENAPGVRIHGVSQRYP